jgi:hypothetical protein
MKSPVVLALSGAFETTIVVLGDIRMSGIRQSTHGIHRRSNSHCDVEHSDSLPLPYISKHDHQWQLCFKRERCPIMVVCGLTYQLFAMAGQFSVSTANLYSSLVLQDLSSATRPRT